MKINPLMIASLYFLSSCSGYTPLEDRCLRPPDSSAIAEPGVRATFLGNTTIFVSDGETNLMVDGFFSRPGILKTLFGKVGPNRTVIEQRLECIGIRGIDSKDSLDAILVGHAHHDHALDAVAVAEITNAQVMGNESYRFIHEGSGGNTDKEHLFTVPSDGNLWERTNRYGKFTVSFLPSGHVGSHNFLQSMVEGHIEEPLKMPAHFSNFKSGDVFAIHIAHPHGNLLVTTTAGTEAGSTQGYRADVVFLGVGLLSKESLDRQDAYWKEYVEDVKAKLIIPVHWDSFNRQLARGLKPSRFLARDVEDSMRFVKKKGQGRRVRVLDLGESVLLRNGQIQ